MLMNLWMEEEENRRREEEFQRRRRVGKKNLYVESLVLYFLARRTQELNQTAFLFKAWSRLMCVVGN